MLNFFKFFFKKKIIYEKTSNISSYKFDSQSKKLADLKKINSLFNELKTEKDKVKRHFMLMEIVSITYRHREDGALRSLCIKTSEKHLLEFPKIRPFLEKEIGGYLPQIPTFKHYARVLEEQGEFEKAIEVCNMAISLGISDGTKSGYQGTVESIKKRTGKL